MKIDFIADTNLLIYIHEGNEIVAPFLKYNIGISFISEVELLGYPNLSGADEAKLEKLIGDCFQIEWNTKIKLQTIQLKKSYNIKLPDAIIASSSLVCEVPLVTADKGFIKIKELDLVLIEI